MAIKLERALDNGYTANYWRVLTIQASADDKTVSGMIGLYKDVETRQSGAKPVSTELYNFTTESLNANLLVVVYEHLKQTKLMGGEDA
jgi:hypothetical protein